VPSFVIKGRLACIVPISSNFSPYFREHIFQSHLPKPSTASEHIFQSHPQEPMVVLALCGLAGTALAIGVPWYYGLLGKTKFVETTLEPALFIFTKHVGPYQNVGSIFNKLFPLVPVNAKMAMISLDPPQSVEPSKLRSLCGLWLPISQDGEKIIKDIFAQTGLSMFKRQMKAAKVKQANFPMRGTLSFMLGPMKVYPAAASAFDPHSPCCGCVEIYHDDRIEFVFSMQNPEDFAWPED